jgi:hypothetical protein
MPVMAHRKLVERQREYLFTGGMPEAVMAYKEENSFREVTAVHRSITQTYQDDFSKYARQKDLILMQNVFRRIPGMIGQKVKYSNVSRDHKSREIKAVIDLLAKARICLPVFYSHSSGLPLLADIEDTVYKLLFMDVGVAAYLSGLDWQTIQSLNGQALVNEGRLAEQFVGQHLLNPLEPPRLTYWLREGRANNAEVDFVVRSGNRIIPVEVKAGKSGSLKSLQQFVLLKNPELCVRFDLNPPELARISHGVRTSDGSETLTYNLLTLPLYLAEELPRLLTETRMNNT